MRRQQVAGFGGQTMIPTDEQPYPLPIGWQWVTLDNVTEIVMGQLPSGDATTDNASYTPLIGGAADRGEGYKRQNQRQRPCANAFGDGNARFSPQCHQHSAK